MDLNAEAIDCQGVTKAFKVKTNTEVDRKGFWSKFRSPKKSFLAVDSVNFKVPKGEIFGILGPNGSGKSTLVRILSTLVFPDNGEARIFGMDVQQEAMEVRRYINRVSVDAAFFKKLSAWENLSYAARLYGIPVKEGKSLSGDILSEMGFERERMDQPLEDLSRGMQQKVAIARALFTSPVLLLMDEPTTGLDPVSKRQVQDYILRVREKHEATILLTTHDMDEAERVCDRVAIIHQGRFIALGSLAELQVQSGCRNGSLEKIFFALTGKDMDHANLDVEQKGVVIE